MPENETGAVTSPLRRDGKSVKRHFEGWQLGAVTVGITLAFAALGVPRSAEPDVFPLPTIDRAAVAAQLQREEERADAAERTQLPFDVRAVGEALRRHGRFSAAGNDNGAALELNAFRSRIALVRTQNGDQNLLLLRAAQTRFFLHALSEWERSGKVSTELAELAGDLPARSENNGWFRHGRLDMTESERSTLFRVRWTELAGLRDTFPFTLTTNEWRVYYRFLLAHPEVPQNTLEPERRARELQLSYVAALERRDPSYFASLARGVLLYQLGATLPAAEALRAHLARHPEGAWQLRARNYLIHTLQQLDDSEFE